MLRWLPGSPCALNVPWLAEMPASSRVTGVHRGEPACRPGSVLPLARGGGHPSRTAVAGSLVRSTREHRAGRPQSLAQGAVAPLLTLLRVGFTEPPQSPAALVVSYTTVSPLPPRWRAGAVCSLWHYPAGHPGSALPTTLSCGARTFLTGLAPGATARPTHPYSGYAERAIIWRRDTDGRWRLAVDSSSPTPRAS